MAPALKADITTPFKKDSTDFKKLVVLVKTGNVSINDRPTAVRSKHMEFFGKYTATQFRLQWANAKTLAGNLLGMYCRVVRQSLSIFGPKNSRSVTL